MLENSKDFDMIQTLPYVFENLEGELGCIPLKLTHKISSGGFGITYEGEYYNLNRGNLQSNDYTPVVVKEFFPYQYAKRANDGITVWSHDPNIFNYFEQKFLKEACILRELSHENIVDVLHYFRANGTSYFVMKKINGCDITDFVENNGTLPLDIAVGYIINIADALRLVHHYKISHNDIKPQNILLENIPGISPETKRPILIDFGASRIYEDDNYRNLSSHIFSQGFTPKELFEGEKNEEGTPLTKFHAESDIYSLAATLYFCVTGIMPPVYSEIHDDGIQLPDYVDPRLMIILDQALQYEWSDRPKNVDDFIRLCKSALNAKLPNGSNPQTVQLTDIKGKSFPKVRIGSNYYESLLNKSTKNTLENSLESSYETKVKPRKEEIGNKDKSDTSKKLNNNKFKNYGWIALFAVILGIGGGTYTVINKSNDEKNIIETNSVKTDLQNSQKNDVQTDTHLNVNQLEQLFKQFADGKKRVEDILPYFADDAWFVVTDGGIEVGTKDEPYHQIKNLFIDHSSYPIGHTYHVKQVYYDENSDLINSIDISKD